MNGLNATHDPARRSWLASANDPATDFPIQNLPFGVYRDADGVARGAVAIGDQVVNIAQARAAGLFTGKGNEAAALAEGPVLNPLLAAGAPYASALRAQLATLLDAAKGDSEKRAALGACLVPMRFAEMLVPVAIGQFSDFLGSLDHTLRMGRGHLPKAFKHLPIAYNGRASSIVVSGTSIVRPTGTYNRGDAVEFGPEPALDFELELGAFIGPGNALGKPFALHAADQHQFGVVLLNDWSARGMQMFESTPLGPFLGKSFATTISPWIVTMEALLPFRVPAPVRDQGDPEPAYLTSREHGASGALDIELYAALQTPKMRKAGVPPMALTTSQFRDMYWTFAQMITHHASNGCNFMSGDLVGSGTTSGVPDTTRACLAEITARGTAPLEMPNGEMRAWLEDGDEVVLRGRTTHRDFVPIGFGECRGRIAAAVKPA